MKIQFLRKNTPEGYNRIEKFSLKHSEDTVIAPFTDTKSLKKN